MREILNNRYIVLSVIGPHAGEDIDNIIKRKQKEIKETGKSFWLIKSQRAKTETIQDLGKQAQKEGEKLYCIFVEPGVVGGAQPALNNDRAIYFSKNQKDWQEIPNEINITGQINMQSTGLVFDFIEKPEEDIIIDLWKYSDFMDNTEPIRFRLGASTQCAVKKSSKGMVSHKRSVVVVAKFVAPYGVYLKNEL